MKFRTTLFLGLVFVLGILGVVYMDNKDQAREEIDKNSELILNYSGESILSIEILPAGFHAVRDSSEWRLLQPIQTGADKNIFDSIASMFTWAKAERMVSADPGDYASFGLQPPRGVLIVGSKTKHDTLYVGDDSQVGSFIYARKAGAAAVFLTSTSLWTNINKTLFDVRDKNILNFEQSRITALEIKSGKELFKLSKEGKDWQIISPKSCRADSRKVFDLLNSIQHQKATRFVEEQPRDLRTYGLENAVYQIKISSPAQDAVQVLSVGKQSDGAYFGRDQARTPVFTVDSSFVHMLRLSMDDLRDKKMIHFDITAADGLELTVGDSAFVCAKDTAGSWALQKPFAGAARGWKISGFLADVENVAAKSFVSDAPASLKPYGLDKPRIRCKILRDSKAVAELLFGNHRDASLIYAKTGSGAAVYLVDRALFDKLNVRLTDLVETSSAQPVSLQE